MKLRETVQENVRGHGAIRSVWHYPPKDEQPRRLMIEHENKHVEYVELKHDGSDLREKTDTIVGVANLPRTTTDKIRCKNLGEEFLVYRNPHIVDMDDDLTMSL